MAQNDVRKALRFLEQNPHIPEKGIRYIAQKLEDEPNTQEYLRAGYQYLRKKKEYPLNHPTLRNIRRLSKAMN
jgi:hypothetical protein